MKLIEQKYDVGVIVGRFLDESYGLQTVFENGEILIHTTLDQIKEQIAKTENL